MHFNNDYEGIRNAFKLETGKDLGSLVTRMNFIIFQMELSSVPLLVAKREIIEEFNNYRVEVKHEERKDDTDRTEKTSRGTTTDSLVKAYADVIINDEDVKGAHETIKRTKAEREQAQNKGKENSLYPSPVVLLSEEMHSLRSPVLPVYIQSCRQRSPLYNSWNTQ